MATTPQPIVSVTAPTSFSIELKGFDFVSASLDASARLAEAHNKYLELMTSDQRSKYIDMEIVDRKFASDLGAPFRAFGGLLDKFADHIALLGK